MVAEVERTAPALGTALKQAVPLAATDSEVTLRMPAGMQAASLERRRGEVEAIFEKVFGRPMRLVVVQGAEAGRDEATAAPSAGSIAEVERAERAARSAEVRAKARTHPNIQEAARILGGDVKDVEEL